VDNPLTALARADLRQRRSVKWRRYRPDVLPLWVAEIDAPLAEPIERTLAAAVARGDTGYADRGRLPEAFAGFARRRTGWAPDPEHMMVIPDVVGGITEVLRLVTRPGDGVVVNPPIYPPFLSVIADLERELVASPLAGGDGSAYRLDLEALDRDRGRAGVAAYLLCNPHNPTGLVLSRAEVAAVARLAARHGVVVLADEIHAPLVYPGKEHTPIATVPGGEAAVVFVSASKAWNLAGLKAALAIAPSASSWGIVSRLPIRFTNGTGLLGVLAAESAFDSGEEWLDALVAGLDHNRALLARSLAADLPGARHLAPDATYLAWLDLGRLGLGDDPAAPLVGHGVALSSGPTFGPGGAGFARLNFATAPEIITEAVRRIAKAVTGPGPGAQAPPGRG
jgi:cystathionine beta-lyase